MYKIVVGRICSTYGGEMHTGFWWGNQKEGSQLEDIGVDRRIILKWVFEKWDVGTWNWIDVVQDRDRWRAGVNAVMNLRVA